MRLIKVEDLKGGEILAKPIISDDYKVLMSEGTMLKADSKNKLLGMGIDELYIIEQDQAKYQEIVLLKSEVEESFKEKVKDVLENHSFAADEEFANIATTADAIIGSILDEDEVVDKIYDIKERSADIYEHSINLCSLATLTALKLNLSEMQVHDIGVGSLLHDMGLKYLNIEYEDQDVEELTKVQLNEYMKHPVYGYSVLRDENWLSNSAKNIVLYHHERLDGSGYPLHAKEIAYEIGVVSVCDVFDEMICGIGCKKVKVHEAVEYLKTLKNIKFYPKIVDALLEFTAVYPVGRQVLLSDGSEGIVVRQNKEFPDRPVIQLSKDKNSNVIPRGKEINLIKVNNLFIEKEINKK